MSDNLDTLMSLMGQKLEKTLESPEQEINIKPKQELIVIENKEFDYNKLDENTSEYLKKKQYEIFNIFNNAYTEIGKILKETQDKLSGNNQYDGLFYKWFSSMGFKKDKVYSLISRYNLLVENSDKQIIIEGLPLSLSYEIAKKTCPIALKNFALSGKITTLKQFKEEYEKYLNNKNHSISNEDFLTKEYEKDDEKIKSTISYILKRLETIKKINTENLNLEEKTELFITLEEIKQKIKYMTKFI